MIQHQPTIQKPLGHKGQKESLQSLSPRLWESFSLALSTGREESMLGTAQALVWV